MAKDRGSKIDESSEAVRAMWNAPVVEELRRHLFSEADAGRAVLLTGPWGAGKTWLWDSILSVDAARGKRPRLYTSLFGAGSLEQVGKRLAMAAALQLDFKEKPSEVMQAGFERVAKYFKKYISHKHGIDLATTVFEPLECLPKGAVVCLDDLERVEKNLGLEVVAGVIDYLVMVHKCRVLVLANPDGFKEENKRDWSALREKVFLFELRLTAHTAAVDTIMNSAGPNLDDDERDAVVRVHERCENANLRRLQRVCAMLDSIKVRLRPSLSAPLKEDFIACLFMLLTEMEAGNLREAEYYFTLPSQFQPLWNKVVSGDDARERAETAISFASRFFSSHHHYRFWPVLHTYVRDGFIGPELEDMTRVRKLPRGEQLVLDLQNGSRLWSMTDAELRKWVSDVQSVLADHNEQIPWNAVMHLVNYTLMAGATLDEDFFSAIKQDVEKRCDDCAKFEPPSMLYLPSFLPDPPGSILGELDRRNRQGLRETQRAEAKALIKRLVETRDPQLWSTLHRTSDSEGYLVELIDDVLAHLDTDRPFALQALEHMTSGLSDRATRNALATKFRNWITTDRTGRKRLDELAERLDPSPESSVRPGEGELT